MQDYLKVTKEYENLVSVKTEGVMFRSKAQWYEQGETNTKYLYSLGKVNYNNKTMRKILLSKGTVATDEKRILLKQYKFYRKLYMSNPLAQFTFLNETDIKLSQEDKIDINKKLNLEELEKSMRKMPSNKTPSSDGLPVEWYWLLWDSIKNVLFGAITYALDKG